MEPNLKPNNKQISIINIDFNESFEQLTEEEKNYLYYLTQACWTGQIIDLFQTSYESPALFMIFQMFFGSFGGAYDLENQIIKKDEQITPEMINNFLEYAAKFYSNFGNYTIKKKKFFPEFNKSESESQAIFENILKTSTRYTEFSSIWQIIKCIIFDKSENVINIDLEEKEGKNCYYLGGIKKEQIQSTDGFLLSKDISLLNTRLFYYNSQVITLIGSITEKQENCDNDIVLLYGEFAPFLKIITDNLKKAKEHTTKEAEGELIEDYIKFFTDGDIKYHKESQKKWVELDSQGDKGWNEIDIDYNIGWNEVDMDPLSARGLFEGFVGFTDNFMSKKYEQIINIIPQLIKELPWSQDFNESDEDNEKKIIEFKSFEIICFAKKGCPYGKTLPNYTDIKKQPGVKNFIFSNVFPNFKEIEDNYYYLNQKDKELIINFYQPAIKIMTSLKFLIGYNIGKLFKYEKNQETNEEIYNFDKNIINPLTNKVIENFENLYKKDENIENRFQYNTLIINECISTLVSLYLCGNESVQEIFYVNKIDNKSVTQACWLLFFTQVISNLNSYNEKEKFWILEQGQIGWIIFNYILSEQKESEELIKIELDETDKEKEKEKEEKDKEKKSFKLIINKELFTDSVNDIISKLLQRLYIDKCLGNVEDALEIINKYSVIDKEKILEVKKIIEKDVENTPLYLFHNLKMVENKVVYTSYKNNKEGIIQSNLERFGDRFNKEIYNQWVKYATNFLKSK
jgi:dipeptidyl-peptidase-3